MDSDYINYLNDSIKQLIESAKKIDVQKDFENGILMGYYLSISFLLSQANAFQILNQLDKEIQAFIPESLLKSAS